MDMFQKLIIFQNNKLDFYSIHFKQHYYNN